MPLTREQYEKAISMAMRDGNQAAADELIKRAAAQMTGAASPMAQLGAGMKDLYVGGKQLVGLADKDEVGEHMRIADMATGGTTGGKLMRGLGSSLPFLLAAPTVAGAALAGGAQGLLMPTENESTLLGKAQNVAEGTIGGAVGQKAFNVAAPVVGGVLKKTLGGARNLLPGGAQRLAERGFVESIPEAERVAAEGTLRGAAGARQAPYASGVSGAPISSGAALGANTPAGGQLATGARNLLGAERIARETAGDIGDPLRDLSERAAQQRWGHLKQEVGGDIAALTKNKQDVQDAFLSTAKIRTPFDSKDTVGQEIVGALNATHNKNIRAELEGVLDQYVQSRAAGDISSLHEFRMTALDDALKRLYKSDAKAAGILRNRIENIKDSFDTEMNRVLGGGKKWAKYKDDYSQAARAVEHAEAGNTMTQTLGNLNPTPGGAPNLLGQGNRLRTAADEVNNYGQPVHSQQAQDAFGTVEKEISTELLPYSTSGLRGSPTGANLNPSDRILGRAIEAQKHQKQGLLSGYNAGAGIVGLLLGPAAGVATAVARPLADARAIDIAKRMIQLHVDPKQAADALVKAGMPPGQVQKILGHVARFGTERAGLTALGTGTGSAMRELDVQSVEEQ